MDSYFSRKEMNRKIYQYEKWFNNEIKIAYLKNYDIDMAALLTSG